MKTPRSLSFLISLLLLSPLALLEAQAPGAGSAQPILYRSVVISGLAHGSTGRIGGTSEVGFTVDGIKLSTKPAAGQTARRTAEDLVAKLGLNRSIRATVTSLTTTGIAKAELRLEYTVPTFVPMRLSALYSTDRTQTIKLGTTRPKSTRQGFGAELRLDEQIFYAPTGRQHPSVRLRAHFAVWNATSEPFEVLRGVQAYDFVLRDAAGLEVWRWSSGRVFASIAPGMVVLAQDEWVYDVDLSMTDQSAGGRPLLPGEYSLEAKLMRGNGPAPGASVTIRLR